MTALCFDFDGTLAHYTGDFASLLQGALRQLGLPEPEHQKAVESFGRHIRQGGPSTLPLLLRGVLQDLEKPEQNVLSAAETMTARYLADLALLPGAEEVLELTRHLPRALITNGPSDMQRAAVRSLDIEGAFQTMIVSGDEDVAVRKPNPRIFEIACERLNVAPEHALMIGDNLEADIQGALAYGMQAVWLSQADTAEQATERVSNTQALYGYLETTLAAN